MVNDRERTDEWNKKLYQWKLNKQLYQWYQWHFSFMLVQGTEVHCTDRANVPSDHTCVDMLTCSVLVLLIAGQQGLQGRGIEMWLGEVKWCSVSMMINGWIRDDLNLWQHLSQYSEVTEQSEYLTQYHRLHTFCLIVVLLNSCLKTVAQLCLVRPLAACDAVWYICCVTLAGHHVTRHTRAWNGGPSEGS